MIENLKESGYTDEQIHLESTGAEFRKFFNDVVEFFQNRNNHERYNEIVKRDTLKEIFQNDEYRKGIIKSFIKIIASGEDVSNLSIEQANNSHIFDDIRKTVDKIIDDRMKEKGEKLNKEEHPNDIWIIDSRLAFSTMPGGFDVRLIVDDNEAGERLFSDSSRGKEDNGKEIAKKWASPKTFIPTQDIRETYNPYGKSFSLDDLIDVIKKYKYDVNAPIRAYEVDGIKYINDGHHRNFVAVGAGQAIIPYNIAARDDEILYGNQTAREVIKSFSGFLPSRIYDHEDMMKSLLKNTGDPNGSKFSYEKTCPKIFSNLYKYSMENREKNEH